VGSEPGADLLPEIVAGEHHWFGLSRFGVIATTVEDTALAFDVLAGTDLAGRLRPPQDRLRVAVSWRPRRAASRDPALDRRRHRGRPAPARRRSRRGPGRPALRHRDDQRDRRPLDAGGRPRRRGDGARPGALQPRTRAHAAVGRWGARVAPVQAGQAERWRERVRPFFEEHDVLVTPAFAATPPRALHWHRRSWMANLVANAAAFFPFMPAWNLADLPCLVLPLWHDRGRPLSVQIVAGPGREELVLAVAKQLEHLLPWRRHAPGWGVPD
jgi:amidase